LLAVSLENITTDVHELEKGMEAVRKEAEIRGKGAHSLVVRDFLANAEEKLRRLKNDAKAAQEAFRECVEYFAESPRTTDANNFFSLLVRFVKAFKQTDQENEQRRRLEIAAQNANNKTNEDVAKRNKINQKKQQDAVINELKHKTRLVQEKKLLQQDEVYNGALEDILLGLKSEPYRRADAVRRSQRRRIDNNRLSKTMEELEV
jgi:predicted nucleotide-binding protein (sugar kinase/HSP70/actin superfamily)